MFTQNVYWDISPENCQDENAEMYYLYDFGCCVSVFYGLIYGCRVPVQPCEEVCKFKHLRRRYYDLPVDNISVAAFITWDMSEEGGRPPFGVHS